MKDWSVEYHMINDTSVRVVVEAENFSEAFKLGSEKIFRQFAVPPADVFCVEVCETEDEDDV